jgi:hypothetical protein
MPLEVLNAIPIEPELMAEALAEMAQARPVGLLSMEEVVDIALSTYGEFYGYDESHIGPEQIEEIVTLARRMIALSEALPRLALQPDPDQFLAMAEAACIARLIVRDGVIGFQPLDFLSAFERAKAELG